MEYTYIIAKSDSGDCLFSGTIFGGDNPMRFTSARAAMYYKAYIVQVYADIRHIPIDIDVLRFDLDKDRNFIMESRTVVNESL